MNQTKKFTGLRSTFIARSLERLLEKLGWEQNIANYSTEPRRRLHLSSCYDTASRMRDGGGDYWWWGEQRRRRRRGESESRLHTQQGVHFSFLADCSVLSHQFISLRNTARDVSCWGKSARALRYEASPRRIRYCAVPTALCTATDRGRTRSRPEEAESRRTKWPWFKAKTWVGDGVTRRHTWKLNLQWAGMMRGADLLIFFKLSVHQIAYGTEFQNALSQAKHLSWPHGENPLTVLVRKNKKEMTL